MENNKDLRNELVLKLQKEYLDFRESLKKLKPEDIIGRAYELVSKEQIKDEIISRSLEEEKMEALVKCDDILSECYDEWLEEDSSLSSAFEFSVDNVIDRATEENEKRKEKFREER